MSESAARSKLAAPPPASGTPDADRLPRSLGVWSAAAVLVGSTIGSGIFRVPSSVAADVGTVGAVAGLWILGVLVALAAGLGIGYVSIRTFEQLADAFILGIWPFYALAVGAVFLLRRQRPDLERPYRTVGYPWASC